MRPGTSFSLVVDASVARSAGQTEHPVSKACREWLDAILTICHHLVMTDEIQEQWKSHASLFTQVWRASMVARKKVDWLGAEGLDNSITERVSRAGLSAGNQEAVMKDLHLLQAALATDRIIITRDDRLRQIVAKHPLLQKTARGIEWINPEKQNAGTFPQ